MVRIRKLRPRGLLLHIRVHELKRLQHCTRRPTQVRKNRSGIHTCFLVQAATPSTAAMFCPEYAPRASKAHQVPKRSEQHKTPARLSEPLPAELFEEKRHRLGALRCTPSTSKPAYAQRSTRYTRKRTRQSASLCRRRPRPRHKRWSGHRSDRRKTLARRTCSRQPRRGYPERYF